MHVKHFLWVLHHTFLEPLVHRSFIYWQPANEINIILYWEFIRL